MRGISHIGFWLVSSLLIGAAPAVAQVASSPVPVQPAPVQPASSAPPAAPVPTTPASSSGTAASPVVKAPTAEGEASAPAFSALPRANAEYRLGPGDLIEVGVFGVDEFRHTVRISASGVVKLPLIDPVNAAGMTAAELEQKLGQMLGTEVIKNPQVSVFVKEYRSQPVYVLGAVRTPGQYQITTQMRIVDAIAMAGGAQPTAGDEATIQRPLADGGEQTITVDLAKILETGDLSRNVVIQGGDVIHVKQRAVETIYVVGEVNRAGAFQKTPKQELRVTQALAAAGGAMKTASLSKGILVRYNEAGQRSEVALDVKAILTGKSPDVFVQANDIIFIPGSTMKSLGYGVMAVLPGAVSAIPYAIIP